MKKLLTLTILINISLTFQAQIVNIPDANFKNALLNHNPIIDINNDGEIQVSEAENVTILNLESKGISSLNGINFFINLIFLNCNDNLLNSFDVTDNLVLEELHCSDNYLNTLNINYNTALKILDCENNYLSNLNLNSNNLLINLNCRKNSLTNLDISNNINLTYLDCYLTGLNNLDVTINTALIELKCGYNNISELNLNTNTNLETLSCFNNNLTNLDISNNLALNYLDCQINNLTNIDVTNNINLTYLNFGDNEINNINLNSNINLMFLFCSNNNLYNLELSSNTELDRISCDNNNFSSLDFSNNIELWVVNCSNNENLTYLNFKNGHNTYINILASNFENLSSLQIVCVDALNSNLTSSISNSNSQSITFTTDCSGISHLSNQIDGNAKIDINNNGCDSSDLSMSNLMVISSNGADSFATFTRNNGDYLLYTNEGNFTTQITSTLPNYYTVNPNTQTNTFIGFDNTFTADFCISPNQTVNDVNITLIPTSRARPGSDATYQIIYKNVGTTQLNGDVILEFDGTLINFSNASETVNTQTNNSVTFNYANLNPFETRTIDLEFDVLATANVDDIINFTTTINPISDDYTPIDNEFHLSQTIVDSFDPNDINILEGASINIENADQYLHYLIRFQNTGTANAINIVVTNMLDANLDWSTLELINTSHPTRVAISNGNDIEFIFENINLPDNTTDEPNSHGFIAYKIKPKTAIAVGDIIPNKADIFFDLNEAVETNIASTTFIDEASNINDTALEHTKIYPNPVKDSFKIETTVTIKTVLIYNYFGQLILKVSSKSIDASKLDQGVYLLKLIDNNGNIAMKKFLKK